MSITLSIPPAVVQEARAYAIKNGTTMSRMIREYFTNLVAPRKAVRSDERCRFLELAERLAVQPRRMPRKGKCEMTFVDSNVFIYAVDKAVSAKQKKARGIVADVFADGSAYRVSSQVLAEFSSVAVRKLGMATPILLALLAEMGKIAHVAIDNALVSRAVEIQGIYGIQYYDAQIVAAAERLGCSSILTEDLNDGQMYCGITALNPFKGC